MCSLQSFFDSFVFFLAGFHFWGCSFFCSLDIFYVGTPPTPSQKPAGDLTDAPASPLGRCPVGAVQFSQHSVRPPGRWLGDISIPTIPPTQHLERPRPARFPFCTGISRRDSWTPPVVDISPRTKLRRRLPPCPAARAPRPPLPLHWTMTLWRSRC